MHSLNRTPAERRRQQRAAYMRPVPFLLAAVLFVLLASPPNASAAEAPWPVKVVVVSMFEHGELSGDRPGEYQLWIERLPLEREWAFPLGEYPLRSHPDGVLAICVGGGIPNAAASIMALGLDPRFDLSDAYWLVAGIAGGDPNDASLGSAVWARHVVDGDLLYEIDAREIPEEWPYGIIPLGGEAPADSPEDIQTGWTVDTIHFSLNAGLAGWAYEQSQGHLSPDTPEMKRFRKQFEGYPAAQAPPQVLMGDTLSASTYWHGAKLNRWANDWMALYAGPSSNFVTSNMEDSGTLTALRRLDRIQRADLDRVMVLRTVSNFTMPPPGQSAAWSTTAPYPNQGFPAIESAYLAGSAVVRALLEDWDTHQTTIPGISPAASPGAKR